MLALKLQNLSLSRLDRCVRVAVVGIGNELNGDDAAGVTVARKLKALIGPAQDLPLRVIDAWTALENVTEMLRSFAPDLVLLIDAAQMRKLPGTIRWLDWRDTIGLSTSTPTLPPYVIAESLVDEIRCEVDVIGIQPYDNSFGMPLSSDVRRAVNEVVSDLQAILTHKSFKVAPAP